MKSIGRELNRLLNEKGIKKKDFAAKLEMSDVNLSKILKKDTIDASLLERISHELNIPVGYFFNEESLTVTTTGNHLANEPSLREYLEELHNLAKIILQQQNTISDMQRTISELSGSVSILAKRGDAGNVTGAVSRAASE